jgi:hypothetical protein
VPRAAGNFLPSLNGWQARGGHSTLPPMKTVKKRSRRRSELSRWQFETEARRQSLVIAAAARNPNSDEAAVMRELDAAFDDMCREIDAEEAKSKCTTSR